MKLQKNYSLIRITIISFLILIGYQTLGTPLPEVGYKPGEIKKSLKRDFKNNSVITGTYKFTENRLRHNYKGGISMDLADMQQIYQTSDINYNFTDENATYTMDIGNVDLVNAQNFVMTNFDFVDYEIGENADVASSPYFSQFPNATHLQYYDYSEWDEYYYEYYKFSSDKIEIIGGVDIFEGVEDIEPMTYIVTPLPLDINTDFSSTEEFTFNDTTYHFEQHVYTEGFGTIQTPIGTFNCLKLANDFYKKVYVGGQLIGSLDTYIYTFYCENGYRLNLYLDPNETVFTGVVDVDFVDVEIPSAITSVKEISRKEEFCYPNPANNILNFQEIGNYQIYNSLGVMILNLENVQNVDISGLSSGLYFIKSETGKTQKLIID